NSDSVTFNPAGTYYWRAAYSGDALNQPATGGCLDEIVTVGNASPTISTTLSETTGSIGDSVHDSSSLSGATGNARGTVTYTVYTDSSCSKGAVAAGTKGVTSGVVPNSDPVTLNSAGTYYWQAVYSGDANNNVATSPCTEEVVTVNKNSPSMTTAQNLRPNDSSTIIGATATATGTATFNLYSPSDAPCSGSPAYPQSVN